MIRTYAGIHEANLMIDSMNRKIEYCNEQIAKESEKWVIKEYQYVIAEAEKELAIWSSILQSRKRLINQH